MAAAPRKPKSKVNTNFEICTNHNLRYNQYIMDNNLFFVGQKAFIEKDGKVLVLFKPDDRRLDIPGGRIQANETDLKLALVREVLEETGLQIKIDDPFYTWTFVIGENYKHAGQTIFLVGYRCEYISGELKISDEHGEYKWVDKESYKELKSSIGHFNALEKYFE